MYAGHIGIALAAKRVRPDVPLWALVAAAQGCDWVNVVAWAAGHPDPASSRWLVVGGWTAQMVSHSVPAVLGLAILVAAARAVVARDGRGAALLAGVTISHVLADYVTSVKPTWPGGPRIGLALYAHPAADFVVEMAVVAGGWFLYLRALPSLPPRARGVPRAAWLMLGALAALQLVADASRPGTLAGPRARTSPYFPPTSQPPAPRGRSQLSSIRSTAPIGRPSCCAHTIAGPRPAPARGGPPPPARPPRRARARSPSAAGPHPPTRPAPNRASGSTTSPRCGPRARAIRPRPAPPARRPSAR